MKLKSAALLDELINHNTLYIIGNGFDLFHGLHTSTTDYCEILSFKDVYGTFDNAYEVFNGYGNDWCDYEKSLSYIDLDLIEEEILSYPDYYSDRESDRDGTVWFVNEHLISLRKAVFGSLREMVEMANNDINDSDKRINNVFKKAAAVINFNYTSTVEKLYEPNSIPILHIHGCYDQGEDLLFGYKEGNNSKEYKNRYFNPSDDGRNYYTDAQRESIAGFYDGLKKELQLKRLEDFLKSISNKVDQICVMGHSMSDVDGDYMEMIDSITNPRKWFISQYNNEPSIDNLKIYPFANKIVFYSLNDLLI
jgi:hypothetical protein